MCLMPSYIAVTSHLIAQHDLNFSRSACGKGWTVTAAVLLRGTFFYFIIFYFWDNLSCFLVIDFIKLVADHTAVVEVHRLTFIFCSDASLSNVPLCLTTNTTAAHCEDRTSKVLLHVVSRANVKLAWWLNTFSYTSVSHKQLSSL